MEELAIAALGYGHSLLVGDVDVLDVEAQHLVRPRGGLVEQPPEAALAQTDALAAPEPLQLEEGEDAGVVRLLPPAFEAGDQVLHRPAAAPAEGDE